MHLSNQVRAPFDMRHDKAQVMGTYWLLIASCIGGIIAAVLGLSAMSCVNIATVLLLGNIAHLLFSGYGLNIITSIGAPAILLVSFFFSGWALSAIRKTDKND
ncbi:hypothetical protein [Rhizobium sullae]|uniref:Uncharacterized protein n=1 Tax=Rhizobium sullae TaxID=50338 RepID=A0A4R3PZI7_RHISU|nr:hypothetical protein [Rhizobium sullae]TCU14123.1 hypothetical protein EV132_110200 [Rhizobium sullae]